MQVERLVLNVFLTQINKQLCTTFCISNGRQCGKYQGLYPAQSA